MNKYQKLALDTIKDTHLEHWINHVEQYQQDQDIFDDFTREILMDFDVIGSTEDAKGFINSVLNKEFENEYDMRNFNCYEDIESMVHQGDQVYAKFDKLASALEKSNSR